MSSFTIKIIAIIAMFIDHAGYAIYGHLSWMNYIGRIAFPLFAFQISEGYIHTSNLKNYFLRLAILAAVSQIPLMMLYSIFTDNYVLNIFFTLMLGLLAITIYDKTPNKILGILGSLLIVIFSHFINVDYGEFGVSLILLFYIFKDKKPLMFLSITLLSIYLFRSSLWLSHFRFDVVLFVIYTILPIFIIFLYNGKKGKNIKHLFYWFYPVHLIVLYFINLIFFK